MEIVVVSLIFATLQAGTAALQWNPTPIHGDTIHACAGRNVTFDWGYTLDPGDIVTSTRWTYRGRSEELVAASVQGSFLPTPDFSHRVDNVGEAGLRLRQAIVDDKGNYTVTVIGFNRTGDSFTESHMLYLQMAASLETTDHNLHAMQQSAVQHSASSDQWHAALSCGNFTYTDEPPISVEWVTPDGRVENSTLYKDGLFHYFLSNPVQEGTYTCRIPADSVSASCASSNDSHEATVVVDGVQTRIMVMEAGNLGLQQTIRNLTDMVVSLQRDNTNLTQKLEAVERDNLNLTRTVADLSAGKGALHVAFRAKFSGSQRLNNGRILILDQVTLNVGDAYDPTTGKFTAPVDGVYYFSAMAAPSENEHSTNFLMVSNTTENLLFNSFAFRENDHAQTGSGQTAMHLEKGQQVWLVGFEDGSSFESNLPTIFSGFLLFAL